MLKTERIVQV